jgi:hypothetical protein
VRRYLTHFCLFRRGFVEQFFRVAQTAGSISSEGKGLNFATQLAKTNP